MDFSYIGLITLAVTILLLLVQRTESTKKRITWAVVILCFLVIRHNAFLKGDFHEETLIGFICGFIFSGIFYVTIGKYNPVGTSDDIKVVGMDD